MNSRYDFMKESKVCDIDGVPYPDPLSVNYSDFAIKEIPLPYQVSSGDIAKFWTHMYRKYEVPYYDDILLNMNGIGYIGLLEPGSVIYDFSLNDISHFNENKRKEVE